MKFFDILLAKSLGGGGGGGERRPWSDPTDGNTHIRFSIPEGAPASTMDIALNFDMYGSSKVKIEWGDGTSEEYSPGSGRHSINHVYASPGDYDLTITNIGPYWTAYSYFFGGQNAICRTWLREVWLGSGARTTGNSFAYHPMLRRFDFNVGAQMSTFGTYTYCGIEELTFTDIGSANSLLGNSFNQNPFIKELTVPEGITSIIAGAFAGDTALTKLTIASTVTSIQNAFNFCPLFEVHSKAATPPSLASATSIGLLPGGTIYVPSASVDAYKAATYWSNYASQIVGE